MIEIRELRVDYGDLTAVHNLSLSIGKGEIYGFIGPNGAGKTSTFKVLATLLEPTFGDVHVGGFNVAEQPREVHQILGYMPDFPPVYEDLRVWEFCELFHAAYGLPAGSRKARSGLDPHSRIELREILKELAAEGRTVLISSHILTEMEGFCTSIGILEKGRLKVTGSIEEVSRQIQSGRRIIVELVAPDSRTPDLLGKHPGVENVKSESETSLSFLFNGDDTQTAGILAALVRDSVPVKSFHEEKLDVEDVFMQVSRGEVS